MWKIGPRVQELEIDDQARRYNTWFRANLRDAMKSAGPRIPHEEAMAEVNARLAEKGAAAPTVRMDSEALDVLAESIVRFNDWAVY